MSDGQREPVAIQVALVDFVGAGLVFWSFGVDGDVPGRAYTGGLDLIRRLAAAGASPDIEKLVDQTVRDLWKEWRQSKRSRAMFDDHIAALTLIMDAHRLNPTHIMSGIVEAGQIRRSGGSVETVAHRLASDIILKARSAGALTDAGLDETLSFFLLVRLIASLLSQFDTLQVLRPTLCAVLGRPLPAETLSLVRAAIPVAPATVVVAKRVPAPNVVAIADQFGIPVATLDAAVAAECSTYGREIVSHGDIEEKAIACTRLQAHLAEMLADASAAGRDDLVQRLERAQRELLTGDLRAVELSLAQCDAAGAVEQPVAMDPGVTLASPAIGLPVARARLAEFAGDWPQAARHYAAAYAYIAPSDLLLRRQTLLWQAEALVAQGTRAGDDRALMTAAQTYAEVCALVSEEAAPLAWAHAHVDLGNLLLVLGNREHRPERFLAAALHFKPAVDVFSRLHAMEDWGHAQFGLAQSLKATGEFQGDVIALGDAAFAYRAALGVLTKDRTAEDWAAAQFGLGETLVRLAEETGEGDQLKEAVLAIKAALALSPAGSRGVEAARGQAALGRAYVALAGQRDDQALLQEAISLLESALASGGRALTASEIAALHHVRGSALWALGESRASVRLLDDAVRAKLAALEFHDSAGDVLASSRLREDLDDLADVIDRLSSAQGRETPQTSRDVLQVELSA